MISKANHKKLTKYQMGDPEAFALLMNLLTQCNYESPKKGTSHINVAWADGMLWQVSDRSIYPDPVGGQLNDYIFLHHAVHLLVARRFGWRYRGMPKVTLLSEALASCLGPYFELSYVRKFKTFSKLPALNSYVTYSEALGHSWYRSLNKAAKDPFATYKNLVLDFINITNILTDYCKSAGGGRRIPPDRIRRTILKVEGFAFLAHSPFGSFVTYAGTFCGLRSCREDLRNFNACLKLLSSSGTMTEFIEAVSISEKA